MITLVSTLVHLLDRYMSEDKRTPFFTYLAVLFLDARSGIGQDTSAVLSGTGRLFVPPDRFWYERIASNGHQAFVVNRVGDFAS